ncbi:ribosome biogenesis GTPase Der [Egibacter rhizosphaerae]|uniref:GTPase Der n=2 Tax=Egibacter rhizosphaerae TaxID=1670831 RepID=A0A411YLS7_9ACTN|nr:ribosome biogenesis GTPase Der [Egibacter rhizosphaerae]
MVAIVGRPNVGKSTLVNRLVGRREAIVEERPGITRDRTVHDVEWIGRNLVVVDTGGWVPPHRLGDTSVSPDPLAGSVTEQAELAAETADVVLLVVDAATGATEEDEEVARWLRRGAAPVLLVANKADAVASGAPGGPRHSLPVALAELYSLGIGDPWPVSALHGTGSGDLLDAVVDLLDEAGAFDRPQPLAEGVPGITLIGRPNVGKSSLFNRLVGEERALVDERPGTTRDAVDTLVEVTPGRQYRFVDTAGLRRRSRVRQSTETYSRSRTLRALHASAVALFVLDASEPVGEQDQKLAREILDAGRAMVLVLNKWDQVDAERREMLERERDRLLHFLPDPPVVRTSATTGRAVQRLPDHIDGAIAEWTRRVPTARLNEWLGEAVAATPPPRHDGRAIKVRYATQVATAPPTVRVFASGKVDDTYHRYLERSLRDAFGFAGSPVDLAVRVRPRWGERDR